MKWIHLGVICDTTAFDMADNENWQHTRFVGISVENLLSFSTHNKITFLLFRILVVVTSES